MSYTLNYTGSEIDDILDRAAPGGALDTAIAAKQDALTFDDAPTSGSDNPVKSGGIYDAIQAGGAAALAAFATDTVSGDVVSFSDGADGIPVKAFTGSILPSQNLNGQSAPYPAGGGKNLLKFNPTGMTETKNGVTATYSAETDAISITGTSSSASAFSMLSHSLESVPAALVGGAKYTLSATIPAKTYFQINVTIGGQASNLARLTNSTQSVTFTFPNNVERFQMFLGIDANAGSLNASVPNIQLEAGNTATSYAPYANICPISGWAGANITRTGRNLFNPHPNHYVNAQGEYIAAGAQHWATDYIPIGNTKSFVVSVADFGGMTDGSIARVAYASDGTVSAVSVGYFEHYTTPWTFTLADNIVGLRFRGYRRDGVAPITGAKIQVEFGNSASTYEPYTADTILLDFGQTVYAGTLTALGGGLWSIQPTHAKATITSLSGSAPNYYTTVSPAPNTSKPLDIICDGMRTASSVGADGVYINSNTAIIFKTSDYATAADLMTAFGGSVDMVYALATLPDPIIVSSSDLATLLGSNTVWTDVGSVTGMTYRADTALYIQKLLNGGGGSLSLSMASPSPSLSLGRVGVLEEQEVAEPEQTDEEAEQLEQTEEPEQTEEE